jgi:hypothetical protein
MSFLVKEYVLLQFFVTLQFAFCFCKVQGPGVYNHDEWIDSFNRFLDHIKIKKVRIFFLKSFYRYAGASAWLWFGRIPESSIYSSVSGESFINNID